MDDKLDRALSNRRFDYYHWSEELAIGLAPHFMSLEMSVVSLDGTSGWNINGRCLDLRDEENR